jgi:hypothetical protein
MKALRQSALSNRRAREHDLSDEPMPEVSVSNISPEVGFARVDVPQLG